MMDKHALAIGMKLFKEGFSKERLDTFLSDDSVSKDILSGWMKAKSDKEKRAEYAITLVMNKSEPENLQDVLDMLVAADSMGDDCPWWFTIYVWRDEETHKKGQDHAHWKLTMSTVKDRPCFFVGNGGWSFYLDDDRNAIMHYGEKFLGNSDDWIFEVSRIEKKDVLAGMTPEQRALLDDDVAF